jgi:hypothetical protein
LHFLKLLAAEVSGNVFWRNPFQAVSNPKQLIHYTVMECEPILAQQAFPGQGPISNKVRLLKEKLDELRFINLF